MIEDKVLKSFFGKRVLITGGTGLIGRQVVDLLVKASAKVTIVSLDKLALNAKTKFIYGDLTDINFCNKITRNKDFVFHIAGIKGSVEVTRTRPASFFVPLLQMNANILEACRVSGVKKIVFTSSIGAYPPAKVFKEDMGASGEPMDSFPGWAKRMAEKQVEAYKIQYGLKNFAIVRPCNVYGPGDNFDPNNAMVVPSLMYRIYKKENPVIVWGDGSAIRDFAFSKDIAEGIILALYYGTEGSFVNLASGKGHSIKQLVVALNSFLDFNYEFDPTKPSGFPKRIMDISRARETIHYNPTTTLVQGLKETWFWFIKNQREYLKKKNYFK